MTGKGYVRGKGYDRKSGRGRVSQGKGVAGKV